MRGDEGDLDGFVEIDATKIYADALRADQSSLAPSVDWVLNSLAVYDVLGAGDHFKAKSSSAKRDPDVCAEFIVEFIAAYLSAGFVTYTKIAIAAVSGFDRLIADHFFAAKYLIQCLGVEQNFKCLSSMGSDLEARATALLAKISSYDWLSHDEPDTQSYVLVEAAASSMPWLTAGAKGCEVKVSEAQSCAAPAKSK